MRCPAGGAVASWVLEVRILARRLYEAHLLGGEGGPDRRHSWGQWTPPEAPGGLGIRLWPWRPPEHWVEGQRSILHNGEARRKGWPRWLGGLRSTEEEPFRRHRQSPWPPGWGRGTLSLSPPGHLRGETKGGQGVGDGTGDRSCGSSVCEAPPQCLVSRTVLCTNRRHLARGDPLKPSRTQSVSS